MHHHLYLENGVLFYRADRHYCSRMRLFRGEAGGVHRRAPPSIAASSTDDTYDKQKTMILHFARYNVGTRYY